MDIYSFWPGQPFSKLYRELGMLQRNYTMFAIGLLDPKLIPSGVVVIRSKQAALQLQAQLDPKRLARIYVQSITTTYSATGAKVGDLRAIGVSRLASAHVLIGGIRTSRPYDVDLELFGSNWLIISISPS